MPDGIALPALALVAAGLIALALVWPQGQGAPSPAPFDHPLAAPTVSPPSATQRALQQLKLRGPEPTATNATNAAH